MRTDVWWAESEGLNHIVFCSFSHHRPHWHLIPPGLSLLHGTGRRCLRPSPGRRLERSKEVRQIHPGNPRRRPAAVLRGPVRSPQIPGACCSLAARAGSPRARGPGNRAVSAPRAQGHQRVTESQGERAGGKGTRRRGKGEEVRRGRGKGRGKGCGADRQKRGRAGAPAATCCLGAGAGVSAAAPPDPRTAARPARTAPSPGEWGAPSLGADRPLLLPGAAPPPSRPPRPVESERRSGFACTARPLSRRSARSPGHAQSAARIPGPRLFAPTPRHQPREPRPPRRRPRSAGGQPRSALQQLGQDPDGTRAPGCRPSPAAMPGAPRLSGRSSCARARPPTAAR